MTLADEIAVFIRAEGFRFDEGMLTSTPTSKSYSRGDYRIGVGSLKDQEVWISFQNVNFPFNYNSTYKFRALANFKSFFVRNSRLNRLAVAQELDDQLVSVEQWQDLVRLHPILKTLQEMFWWFTA